MQLRVLAVCWCGVGATRRGRRAGHSGPVSSVGGHSSRGQSAPIGWCATAGLVCRLQRAHLVGWPPQQPTPEVAAAAARLNVPFVSRTCPPVDGCSDPSRRSARLGVYAIVKEQTRSRLSVSSVCSSWCEVWAASGAAGAGLQDIRVTHTHRRGWRWASGYPWSSSRPAPHRSSALTHTQVLLPQHTDPPTSHTHRSSSLNTRTQVLLPHTPTPTGPPPSHTHRSSSLTHTHRSSSLSHTHTGPPPGQPRPR